MRLFDRWAEEEEGRAWDEEEGAEPSPAAPDERDGVASFPPEASPAAPAWTTVTLGSASSDVITRCVGVEGPFRASIRDIASYPGKMEEEEGRNC